MSMTYKLAAVTLLATAGCASFDGMPQPIFKADETVARVTRNYPFDDVVRTMAGQDVGFRTVYRNRVAAAYMMAIDARYFEFRRGLSRNMKGGNLGFDFALLALTGGAAIWEEVSSDLAAAATGVAGARGSINRELYFERALPGLVSLMETQRLEIRSSILRGLRQSEDEYTVQELFADLSRYEGSASIDGAIQRSSEIAGQQAQEARLDFTRTIELCQAPDAVAGNRSSYLEELYTGRSTAVGRARFARAAVVAGVAGAQPTEDPTVLDQQLQSIADHMLNICTQAALDSFKQQVDPPAPAPAPGGRP